MQISLGEDLAEDFEQQLRGLVSDPRIQRRVNAIGFRLLQTLTQMEVERRSRTGKELNWAVFNFRFKVLNTDKINAFALPDGSIYITRGLLRYLGSDDQLATVLSHEMGHVVLRHAAKALAARLKGNVVVFAFQVLFGKELAQLVGGAAYLLELSYSREQEREADHVGYLLACFAGYDPQALIEVFELFKRLEGQAGTEPELEPEFLRTHPLPQTRIDYLKGLSCELPGWQR